MDVYVKQLRQSVAPLKLYGESNLEGRRGWTFSRQMQGLR